MIVLLYCIAQGVNSSSSGSPGAALLLNVFCFMLMSFASEAHEGKLLGFFLLGLAVGSTSLPITTGRLAALSPENIALSENEHTALVAAL